MSIEKFIDEKILAASLGGNSTLDNNLIFGTNKTVTLGKDGTGSEAVRASQLQSSIDSVKPGVLGFATRALLKAANTNAITHSYLTEINREGEFVWRTGDFTARLASDTFEGIYIKADAVPISSGCWVRVFKENRYEMNWFGALTAVDILPIWNKVKLLAAGGTLVFGEGTYTTSNTLFYEAPSNKPMWITGISASLSIISMQGTGFAIKYYGEQGGTKEVRGGGVFKLKIEKSGGGTCSGIELANAYRSEVKWCETFGPGINIGCSIGGRGAGDYDATFGCTISENRFRNGNIGIRFKPDENGAIQSAQNDILNNNLDGNAVTGIWLAGFDQVLVRNNTITTCGHGGGALLNRGNLYVEHSGITSRNLRLEQNEFGNNISGGTIMVIVDSILGMRTNMNRFIRNTGEFGNYSYYFGFAVNNTVVDSIKLENDYLVVQNDTPAYIHAAIGGTNLTVINPIEISNIQKTLFNETFHVSVAQLDAQKIIETKKSIDVRNVKVLNHVVPGGAFALSTNKSIKQKINVTSGTSTTITVSGASFADDVFYLQIRNSVGPSNTITLSTGFDATALPTSIGTYRAIFLYDDVSGVWRQNTAWLPI